MCPHDRHGARRPRCRSPCFEEADAGIRDGIVRKDGHVPDVQAELGQRGSNIRFAPAEGRLQHGGLQQTFKIPAISVAA